MTKQQFIVSLFLLLVVALTIYWRIDTSSHAVSQYITYSLARGDILTAIKTTGIVEPLKEVEVSAQTNGIITALGSDPTDPTKPLDSGTRIFKGSVLAKINNRAYQEELSLYQQNKRLTEAEVRRAQLEVNKAQENLKRIQLTEDISGQHLGEQALTLLNMVQADLTVAQEKQKQAHAAEKVAQLKVDATLIRSPIDGMVIDRRAEVGQTVVAGTPLVTIVSDLKKMRIRAAVNEADISKISVGQKTYLTIEAYPEKQLTGVVSQVRLNANIFNNIVTYDVIIDTDDLGGGVFPYMTTSLKFVIEERLDVFMAPPEALNWQPEGSIRIETKVDSAIQHVWQLREGEAYPIEVSTGLSDGSLVEIIGESLYPGMVLILARTIHRPDDFGSTILKSILGH